MKRLLIVLTSLAVLSCSEGRERPVASNNKATGQPDLTLPDTLSRTDSSTTLATRSGGSDSVERQEKAPPPKPRRATRPRARTATAPKPAKPVADTGVQGYAPALDTTPQRDSVAAAQDTAVESTRLATTNTADSVSTTSDSVPRESTLTPPDTLANRKTDTISTLETSTPTATSPPLPPQDSVPTSPTEPVVRSSDTTSDTAIPRPAPEIRRDTLARAPTDTTSTPERDTTVASTRTVDVAARTLQVGTEIHASLNDSITSRRDTAGQIISAHVMQNVRGVNGRTLIPAGTRVQFTVTRIRPARSKNSQGRLALEVNGFEVEGDLLPVQAEVRPVPRELRGRGVGGSEVAKVGGGAAAGAILGRVVGGNTRGAVIGGVAGAAAGAVLADQTATRDVVVKAKTPVVFVLTAPLLVDP
ncbi:MAG TPA: glycine zipper domain-containing protein [Gemmatimonadales bacterium]|nr:glycine zipper domain-containing protein [Gemmatimonadales bacterium]